METIMPNARETIAVGAIVGLEKVSRYQGVPSARAGASRDRAGAISRDQFHSVEFGEEARNRDVLVLGRAVQHALILQHADELERRHPVLSDDG
jgi:hypothetical protein